MEIFNKHPQWPDVKKICTKIREQGYTAWLAGGCVRDGLMGVLPHDFDIATNARPKKIESFFNRTVDVGKAFGVIRVIEKSGDIEVATFRKDGAYIDGRHPVNVELSSPQEDARRRDFTINALFYDPFEGETYDYVEGSRDIQLKIIRTVGFAADRFLEDRLRILRAVRFVSQLDFSLEAATYEAVCKFAPTVNELKYERIQDEMNKLLRGARPDRAVKLLRESGLLAVILPEVTLPVQESEVFFKKICSVETREVLGWVYLISHAKPADDKEKIYRRLKFSNEKRDQIQNTLELVTSLMIFNRLSLADKKRAAADKNVALALLFLELGGVSASSTVNFLTAAAPSNFVVGLDVDLGEAAEFLGRHQNLPTRFIEAQDLISLGVTPGKRMGELIEKSFEAQLEEKFFSKPEALEWVKTQIKKDSPPAN